MGYEEVFECIDRHVRPKDGARLMQFDYEGQACWILESNEAVRVFRDEQSLCAHRAMLEQKAAPIWDDGVVAQDCVILTYVDRDELDKEDYALIKEIGRKYRGKKMWPQLRRLQPYRIPWGLNETDCDLLCAALDALQGDAQEMNPDDIVPAALPVPAAQVTNELLLTRFNRMQTTQDKWDITVQAFPFPMGSDEENGAPCCPLMLLAVDEPTDQVICISVSPVSEANYQVALAQDLLTEAVKRERRPGLVRFANAKAEQLLGDLFEKLGIATEREEELPQLKDAFESLMRFANGDMEE